MHVQRGWLLTVSPEDREIAKMATKQEKEAELVMGVGN